MSNGKFRKKPVYFTQVSNQVLRDDNLSLKAKGLFSLIQSYITIEDFVLYKDTLKQQCKEGDKAFESTWKELKKHGYLIQYKMKSEEGKFYYEYELQDTKTLLNHIENHTPKKEGMENGKPHPQKGGGGKGGVYNNTDINNTYSLKDIYIEKPSKKCKKDTIKKTKKPYGEFVKLTIEEFDKLVAQFGHDKTIQLIQDLDIYIGSKGDKYKNHYFTILSWNRKAEKDNVALQGKILPVKTFTHEHPKDDLEAAIKRKTLQSYGDTQ